jgi:hypothetical protein
MMQKKRGIFQSLVRLLSSSASSAAEEKHSYTLA